MFRFRGASTHAELKRRNFSDWSAEQCSLASMDLERQAPLSGTKHVLATC